jgi:hypothetical protein
LDESGLGSFGIAVFGINVLTSSSAIRSLVIKTGLRKIRYDDGRWMELTHDDIQWCNFVSAERSGSDTTGQFENGKHNIWKIQPSNS